MSQLDEFVESMRASCAETEGEKPWVTAENPGCHPGNVRTVIAAYDAKNAEIARLREILDDVLGAAAAYDDKPHQLFSALMRAATAEGADAAMGRMAGAYEAPSTRALTSRIETLREALKPFADVANEFPNHPDGHGVIVAMRHFRRALEALEESK